MAAAVQVNIQKNWMHVTLANRACTTEAFIDKLHEELGLTKNPKILHKLFSDFKKRHKWNLGRVMKESQWNIWCHNCSRSCSPPCPKKGVTDLKDFDLTNVAILYRNLSNILPNFDREIIDKFFQKFDPYLKEAIEIRNFLMHASAKLMTDEDCDEKWNAVEKVLLMIGYSNMKLFYELKTCSLEPSLQQQVCVLEDAFKWLIESKDSDRDEVAKALKQLRVELDIEIKKAGMVELNEKWNNLMALVPDFERRLTLIEGITIFCILLFLLSFF